MVVKTGQAWLRAWRGDGWQRPDGAYDYGQPPECAPYHMVMGVGIIDRGPDNEIPPEVSARAEIPHSAFLWLKEAVKCMDCSSIYFGDGYVMRRCPGILEVSFGGAVFLLDIDMVSIEDK